MKFQDQHQLKTLEIFSPTYLIFFCYSGYIEFGPEGVLRLLFGQQAASFEHNFSYAQPIVFKFIDWIGNILNLLTVEKKLANSILVALVRIVLTRFSFIEISALQRHQDEFYKKFSTVGNCAFGSKLDMENIYNQPIMKNCGIYHGGARELK